MSAVSRYLFTRYHASDPSRRAGTPVTTLLATIALSAVAAVGVITPIAQAAPTTQAEPATQVAPTTQAVPPSVRETVPSEEPSEPAASVGEGYTSPQRVDETTLIVYFHPGVAADSQREAVKQVLEAEESGVGFGIGKQGIFGESLVTFTRPVDTAEVMLRLNARDEVFHAEENAILTPASVVTGRPNDLAFEYQWALSAAHADAPSAWPITLGQGQNIAIIDSGITDHPDLNAKVLPGYDVIDDMEFARDGDGHDADAADPGDWVEADTCLGMPGPAADIPVRDSTWHGTMVAGVAAAETDNGEGIAGVAPEASILPVRAMHACGGSAYDMAYAIAWAAGANISDFPPNPNPATVINLSVGSVGRCDLLQQSAVNMALRRNIPVVAAAGNEGIDAGEVSPANCSGVIAVAASDYNSQLASYSNTGLAVDIAAPGADNYQPGIISTTNAGTRGPAEATYTQFAGTSAAAPIVSGGIALMRAVNPELSVAQLTQILKDTARPMDCTAFGMCGAGNIDIGAAVAMVADSYPAQSTPVVPTSAAPSSSAPSPEPSPEPTTSRSVPDPTPHADGSDAQTLSAAGESSRLGWLGMVPTTLLLPLLGAVLWMLRVGINPLDLFGGRLWDAVSKLNMLEMFR